MHKLAFLDMVGSLEIEAVFIQQCVPDFRNLTLGSFLLHLLLLLPFHICHIFLCMISWFTFANGLILYAAIGTSTLTALDVSLLGLLRCNAGTYFSLVFAFSDFYGWHFLVYLGLHAPTSAYFTIQIAFGWTNSLSKLMMLGLIGEAIVGTLFLHLYAAYFTAYIHRGGKMLLQFNAVTSLKRNVLLLPRTQLLTWIHLQRLWVRHNLAQNMRFDSYFENK
ncbi:hypothetical protein TYRP_016372 [Tyrophagus putrescentiae]|nr:hypothetical protein TYRP_016372 [Tyrophagus putrescentiae]